jgi:hypothetical protein
VGSMCGYTVRARRVVNVLSALVQPDSDHAPAGSECDGHPRINVVGDALIDCSSRQLHVEEDLPSLVIGA